MIIRSSNPFPSLPDLIPILRKELPPGYDVRLFGIGKSKSIMIRQSTWIGAQLTINKDEVMVEGSYPNLLLSFFMTFLSVLIFPPTLQWVALEKQVTSVLKRRFP